MVMTDGDITDHAILPANGGIPEELATFCRTNDEKVPTVIGTPDQSVVEICPEEQGNTVDMVTRADANGFQVRIVFDELLDPSVETLIDSGDGGPCTDTSITCDGSLAQTQPVVVRCNNAEVEYDGYYAPNGNRVSWPPGPSLVVIAQEFVATSSSCTVELRERIKDKQGIVVPTDQRGTAGTYAFETFPLEILGADPADGDELANDAPAVVSFNAPILDGTVAANIVVEDSTGPVAAGFAVDGSDITILPPGGEGGTWTLDETYTITISADAAITDIEDGPYAGGEFVTTFTAVAP